MEVLVNSHISGTKSSDQTVISVSSKVQYNTTRVIE